MTKVQIPEAFEFLFENSRYKAAHGGRGSAKSHSIAQALVIRARQRPLTIGCFREIQNSIRDSVKRLLDEKIETTGLSKFYRSTDAEIRGANGSLFIFKGLRNNPDTVKSTEGVDLAWVEEANTVSQASLDVLVPTIRKPGSELWFSWNPKLPTDPVDKMFRDGPARPGAIIREVNFDQNPFFPDVLREEMEWDRRRDPDKYAHVWLGKYQKNSEARVFHNYRVEEFETPERGVEFYYGADWGFSIDPSVLVRCFIVGKRLYVDHEAYKIGCEIDDLPKLFAGKAGVSEAEQKLWTAADEKNWPGVPGAKRWRITADSARPETISYMGRNGFTIEGAKKGAGSVEDGIEFLKNYDIIVHPRCKHMVDELAFYSWKTDRLTGAILSILEDKKNHVIDSLRYAVEGIRSGAALWARLGRAG